MKKRLLPKMWLLVGSALLLACSCSGDKPQKSSENMQEEKKEMPKAPADEKGPQQQPFQRCEAMDSECEEGASLEILEKDAESIFEGETATLMEAFPTEESQEQALFVTPIVIEAVKIQLPAEESAVATQQTPSEEAAPAARVKEKSVSETASAGLPEAAPSAE